MKESLLGRLGHRHGVERSIVAGELEVDQGQDARMAIELTKGVDLAFEPLVRLGISALRAQDLQRSRTFLWALAKPDVGVAAIAQPPFKDPLAAFLTLGRCAHIP